MARIVGLALALVLAAAQIGCGRWPGPARALLGNGWDAFRPLPSCAQVTVVQGMQGGFHVWGAVRARWVDRRVTLQFTVADAATGEPLEPPIRTLANLESLPAAALRVADEAATGGEPARACPEGGVPLDPLAAAATVPGGADGWAEVLAELVFMPFTTVEGRPVVTVDGRPVTIGLDVTDGDGRTASDARTVVPVYRPTP